MIQKHTHPGPIFGRLVEGCPRCAELASGMAPRRWSSYHARKAEQALAADIIKAPDHAEALYRGLRDLLIYADEGAFSDIADTHTRGRIERARAACAAYEAIPAPRTVPTDVRRVKPW